MVNASLNWASIVGIVLAVCGGGLYFLRSFKPALARDYDVFFAAIGLLCGGILFFQGWRLDPILQFGQFLLAGTTVFFAYESVRLRGIATDQARRSSFFEDNEVPSMPRNASRNRWDEDYEKFDEPERPSRRFRSRDIDQEDNDFGEERVRPRRVSRTIPESAVSRRRSNGLMDDEYNDSDMSQRRRFRDDEDLKSRSNNFGARRNIRNEVKRGSRPSPNRNASIKASEDSINNLSSRSSKTQRVRSNVRTQIAKNKVEDASFTQKNSNLNKSKQVRRTANNIKSNTNQAGRYNVGSKNDKPRDNSSRFDD